MKKNQKAWKEAALSPGVGQSQLKRSSSLQTLLTAEGPEEGPKESAPAGVWPHGVPRVPRSPFCLALVIDMCQHSPIHCCHLHLFSGLALPPHSQAVCSQGSLSLIFQAAVGHSLKIH